MVPADAATRDWEKIRDESSLVPLPLNETSTNAWRDLEIAWFSHDGPHRRYEYLLRKGHVGAPCHLYPSLRPDHLYALLIDLGFNDDAASREAARREKWVEEVETLPATKRLREHDHHHEEVKDSFSRAFVEAQKRKQKRS